MANSRGVHRKVNSDLQCTLATHITRLWGGQTRGFHEVLYSCKVGLGHRVCIQHRLYG